MKHEVTLVVFYDVPSLNSWQRMHWRDRVRHKKDLAVMLGESFWSLTEKQWEELRSFTPLKKARLEIEAFKQRDVMDDDNLCIKALVDAVKTAGLIVDDSRKYVRIKAKSGKRPRGAEPFARVTLKWNEPKR